MIPIFILVLIGNARAADHLDGLAVLNDPSTDITDVYAWLQNSEKVNLILNVFPLADASSKFSDSASYVFNVSSKTGYGVAGTNSQIICSFATDQKVTCSLGGSEKISNEDATQESGVSSASGDFKVFTGLRDDPFFFDLANFNAARVFVRDNAGSLTFDGAGCPALDAGTRGEIVSTLTGGASTIGGNGSPTDFFNGLNVLSIVVQVDKSLLGAGPIYSVAAATHNR